MALKLSVFLTVVFGTLPLVAAIAGLIIAHAQLRSARQQLDLESQQRRTHQELLRALDVELRNVEHSVSPHLDIQLKQC